LFYNCKDHFSLKVFLSKKNKFSTKNIFGRNTTVPREITFSFPNGKLLINTSALYCNYELLVNIFKGQAIDLTHAETFKIDFDGQKKWDVFFSLLDINKYKKETIFKH
jgi:hypothetical protein